MLSYSHHHGHVLAARMDRTLKSKKLSTELRAHELLTQWNALKEEIRSSTGLNSRKDHDLWAHMLIHFTDEYPLPLMLVVVVS